MVNPVRLLLVDDHLSYRESFRIALTRGTGFDVVGEADGARECISLVEALRPDLAIVDFFLTDTDGVSLARELKRRRNRTPILLLTQLSHPLFVRDALSAGVRGYVLKREPLAALLEAIALVARGERYVSPQIARYLEDTAEKPAHHRLARLSRREREVLCLLVDGRSSKEISQALCISVRTVDAHRLHINRKLAIHSPAQLARYAVEEGLLSRLAPPAVSSPEAEDVAPDRRRRPSGVP